MYVPLHQDWHGLRTQRSPYHGTRVWQTRVMIHELEWNFILGFVLFLYGLSTNLQSDKILIKMKTAANGQYVIPRGGMFDYVSAVCDYDVLLSSSL